MQGATHVFVLSCRMRGVGGRGASGSEGAGGLGQAAFNPRHVLTFLTMGDDMELDITEASRFVRPGEAISYWSLQAGPPSTVCYLPPAVHLRASLCFGRQKLFRAPLCAGWQKIIPASPRFGGQSLLPASLLSAEAPALSLLFCSGKAVFRLPFLLGQQKLRPGSCSALPFSGCQQRRTAGRRGANVQKWCV